MKKKLVITLVIIICIILLLGGGYVLYKHYNPKDNNTNNEETTNDKIELTKSYSIKKGGEYTFTGSIKDGNITIDTDEEVSITLDGVSIENTSGPAINIISSKKTTINLVGENKLKSNTTEDLDASIYSISKLEINGNGTLYIESNYGGILSKEDIIIKNGTFNINSDDTSIKSKKNITVENGTYNLTTKGDGIHADGMLVINNGTYEIDAEEGLEATYIKINDGTININASDDGINASHKSDDYEILLEINGGTITVSVAEGDTDCIDSNGNIIVNGGTINLKGNSTWDYDGEATYNGGTIIENGVETNSIKNSMMMGGPNEPPMR
ncbi:MAG: carbohydrate-binding domain-containing protein [Bacilli bacterium]|nr:carbohydrate-binding domain-containing protein [Bacilli bacterium]